MSIELLLGTSRTGRTHPVTSLVLDKRKEEKKKKGLFLNHFLLSYFFFSTSTLLIHQPTLFPFSPHCSPPYSSAVFSICFLSCSFSFFRYILPSCHDSLVTKWHIVKVLYFPTSSLTHSELGAKCSWCAARWTSWSATKLAPSHACTPGMHSHSMGFLSVVSYMACLLFLSCAGLIKKAYKSNL